jgi:glycosyltransferase involved in cell wall biosynthesis
MHIALNALAARKRLYGGGVYARNLICNLARIDRKNQYTLYVSPAAASHFVGLGPNVQLRPAYSNRLLRLPWEQTGLPLDLAQRKVQVVHGMGYVAPYVRVCSQVTTVHDLTVFLVPETYTFLKRHYFKRLIPLSVRRSDAIITDSESARNDLVSLLGVAPEKVRAIHLGKDECFKPMAEDEAMHKIRQKYNLTRRIILFTGMIEPRKNLARLIQAFAQLRAFHEEYCLVLVGDFGWHYDGVLRSVTRLGLQESVIFVGFVPGEELPLFYNLADVFVYPSLYEGFGLPVLEAMACGVPVITSNVSAMPEVAGEAALLVDPRSPKELATAMERVLTDRDLRSRLRRLGLERSQHFSWEKTARETLRVYETVAG